MKLYNDPRLQGDLFERQKGLFWPAAVREALSRTERDFPSQSALERLQRWHGQLVHVERRSQLSEAKHKVSFLSDIFEDLLGFATAGSADVYHMEYELSATGDNRPADAALCWRRDVMKCEPPGVMKQRERSRETGFAP